MLRRFLTLASILALLSPISATAADHTDSPAVSADPTADITDLFAWMSSDASMLNMVIGVFPFATAEAAFADSVTYAFHVNSSTAYGEAQTETLVLCQFYDVDAIECWAGDAYVAGDPSDTAGIANQDGTLRVYAGLRDDPFFFNSVGFNATVATVVSVAGDLTFDDEGCPAVDADTSAVLVGQLGSGLDGASAEDSFAGTGVLALVVQIDKSLVTAGGPLLSVWVSTHRAN